VLATRELADVTIMRGVGRPFVELPGGDIGNPVKIKVVNRSDKPARFTITLSGAHELKFTTEENSIRVAPGQGKAITGMIAAPAAAFQDGTSAIRIAVSCDDPPIRREVTYRLMGPASGHHGPRREEGSK
jgi:hypothetical protein